MEIPPQDPPASPEELRQSYAQVMGEAWESEPPISAAFQPSDTATPPPFLRILESLLFVGGEPLAGARVCEIVRGIEENEVERAVSELNALYKRQNRPYFIRHDPKGFVLILRPAFGHLKERLFGGVREARLSTVAVDVLALVAYRQPTTKAEIDSLRGADSGSLLKQLVRRGLVQIMYRGDAESKEVCYGTTPQFLEFIGIASLEDLPRTPDLQQI